jgi:DNA-binding NarL/FixJ family response regulator
MLKILVIGAQPIVRDAWGRLVAQLEDGAAWLDAEDAAAGAALLADRDDVALAIVEVAAQSDATAAVGVLRAARASCPLLAVAAHDDASLARAALGAGARGFVSTRAPLPVLREVVRLLLAGGSYIPPAAAGVGAASASGARPIRLDPPRSERRAQDVRLTERQQAVLALLLKGRPNKAICRTLDLREGTVKTHIANIFRLLHVNNRTAAAYAVMRLGIALPEVEERPPRTFRAPGLPLPLAA